MLIRALFYLSVVGVVSGCAAAHVSSSDRVTAQKSQVENVGERYRSHPEMSIEVSALLRHISCDEYGGKSSGAHRYIYACTRDGVSLSLMSEDGVRVDKVSLQWRGSASESALLSYVSARFIASDTLRGDLKVAVSSGMRVEGDGGVFRLSYMLQDDTGIHTVQLQ